MATGLDLVRMPGFAFPENARLDFTPLRQALQHRTEVGLRQQQADREMERLGLDRNRFGLQERQFAHQTEQDRRNYELSALRARQEDERARLGLDLQGRRVALEDESVGLRRTAAEREVEEQQRIRMANEAFRIQQERDPARRVQRFRSFLETSPTFAREVGRLGFRLGDGGEDIDPAPILDRIISQVPDAGTRYRPPPLVPAPPGHTLGRVTPEGGFEPVYTAPSAPRHLSPRDLSAMRDEGMQLSTVTRLGGAFQDSWTMPGATAAVSGGDYQNWFARHMPRAGSTARDAAAWWADYQRNVELAERHAMFGASLTPPEQAAWRAASITPNMRPDLIRQHLQTRQQIMQTGMTRYAQSLVSAGYSPDAIATAYGIDPRQLRPGGGGGPPGGGPDAQTPPVPGARRAPDGHWYVPDPNRQGRFLRVDP